MNINANELLLINKNMKFRGEEPASAQEGASVSEPPVTNPQTGLNALQAQGMNNISFQGVNLAAVKKMGLNAMLALTLLGGTAALSSCEGDTEYVQQPPVEITNNITIDFSQQNALLQQMLAMYQQMLDQQKITNEYFAQTTAFLMQMMSTLTNIQNNQQNNQEVLKAYYEQMWNFMLQSEANQQVMINLLTQNNMNQEEAIKFIQELINEVKAGNLTAAEAYAEIMKKLGNIEDILSISMEQIKAFQQDMIKLYQQMLEQNQITNSQMTEMNQKLQELIDSYNKGNMDAREFYAAMYKLMIDNSMNQRAIIALLVKNGKTQEEANKLIQDLIAQVKAGNLTAAEAYAQIMEQLGYISDTLQGILAELKNISENITMFRESYEQGKKETAANFEKLYNQGVMQTAYLKAIGQGLSVMNENIISMNNNITELKAIVSDDSKFKELMEQLKSMETSSVDYQKFEEMFKLLNMNLQDVINKASSNITGAINDVNNNIDNFRNTYVNVEAQNSQKLSEINNKLTIISNFPGLDQSAIEGAIKDLVDAINNNTNVVGSKVDSVGAKIDAVLAKLDAILKEIGTLSASLKTYADLFDKKFDAALEKLLSEFSTSMASVKQEQQISNQYLKYLTNKADEILAELQNLKNISGSGMTVEEFQNVMLERDQAQYEKYAALIKSLGIKIDTTNAKLDDLIKAINAWKQEQKDYSSQLDRIIALLDGINWSSPDYNTKLDKIIELLTNFKCNCDCSGNTGSNEGIIDDLENLLG